MGKPALNFVHFETYMCCMLSHITYCGEVYFSFVLIRYSTIDLQIVIDNCGKLKRNVIAYDSHLRVSPYPVIKIFLKCRSSDTRFLPNRGEY